MLQSPRAQHLDRVKKRVSGGDVEENALGKTQDPLEDCNRVFDSNAWKIGTGCKKGKGDGHCNVLLSFVVCCMLCVVCCSSGSSSSCCCCCCSCSML